MFTDLYLFMVFHLLYSYQKKVRIVDYGIYSANKEDPLSYRAIKNGANRLYLVQKATSLKNKSGNKLNVQQLLRQLQSSDHRFRAMSAHMSAASPEING